MTIYNEKIKDLTVEDFKTSNKKRDTIISVKNLKTYFPVFGGLFKRTIGYVKAVDGVTFDIYKGETVGLVGESGCGKTSIGNTILNLVPATSGRIYLKNQNIVIGSTEKKKLNRLLIQQNTLRHIMFIPLLRIASPILRLLFLKRMEVSKSNIKKINQSIKNYLTKLHSSIGEMYINTIIILRQNY
ncbi:hypothetical protein LCGC14_3154610, partial [marine sediment metagenome]